MSPDTPEKQPDTALESLFYHTEQIRLVYWSQFSGAKSAVHLVAFITVLSFITGLSNLSQQVIVTEGPLAIIIPSAESFVRFAGVFFSFVLSIVVLGLNRRRRLAWYAAVVILPVVTILPLTTYHVNDIPLLLLILITYPLLILNRQQFDQAVDLSPIQIAALSSVVGVITYGTVGSYTMRDQYVGIESWTDAVYYVIVTMATVGYGDATPIAQETKWFTLSFIIIGTGAFTAAIGSILIPTIESRMAAAVGHMTQSELTLLEDHVLVLGYGNLTEPLLDELGNDIDVVVITPDSEDATEIKKRGLNVLTDDPTNKETLRKARIDSARAVVIATEDDAKDVMAVIAVKQTNPEVFVVAAANDYRHIDKFEAVGADKVINPIEIGGRLLGQSVLNDSYSVFSDDTNS